MSYARRGYVPGWDEATPQMRQGYVEARGGGIGMLALGARRSRVSLEISGHVAAGAFVCWLTLTPPLRGRYTPPQIDRRPAH